MYKLSVIICVYNEEESIINALRSLFDNKIFSQTEVLLIDDNSTNARTIRILELLSRFTRYHIIRNRVNQGLSNSRNLGFSKATTPYILPLDADDIFPASALDTIYETFTNNPSVDFIAGDYYLINAETDEKKLIDCSTISIKNMVNIEKLAIEWKLLGTSPCKKTTWENVGGYSLKYSHSVQDIDFWIRVLRYGGKGLYLNKPIYTWNKSISGMNANFNTLKMTELMEEHIDFFHMSFSKKYLVNKIFEDYYPYKQRKQLIPLGKKYFFNLKPINKSRFIYYLVTSPFIKKNQLIDF